jgi:hypothetical protein
MCYSQPQSTVLALMGGVGAEIVRKSVTIHTAKAQAYFFDEIFACVIIGYLVYVAGTFVSWLRC